MSFRAIGNRFLIAPPRGNEQDQAKGVFRLQLGSEIITVRVESGDEKRAGRQRRLAGRCGVPAGPAVECGRAEEFYHKTI